MIQLSAELLSISRLVWNDGIIISLVCAERWNSMECLAGTDGIVASKYHATQRIGVSLLDLNVLH